MITILTAAGIAALPTITAIAGICIAVGKFCKHVKTLKDEVVQTKQYDELKEQLLVAHKEHIETQKRMNELIEIVYKLKMEQGGK